MNSNNVGDKISKEPNIYLPIDRDDVWFVSNLSIVIEIFEDFCVSRHQGEAKTIIYRVFRMVLHYLNISEFSNVPAGWCKSVPLPNKIYPPHLIGVVTPPPPPIIGVVSTSDNTSQKAQICHKAPFILVFFYRFLSSRNCCAINSPIGFNTHFIAEQLQKARKIASINGPKALTSCWNSGIIGRSDIDLPEIRKYFNIWR